MKKRTIYFAIVFLLVLFLASPLFGSLVGGTSLSKEEVRALRTDYPIQEKFHPMITMELASFPEMTERADTLAFLEITRDYLHRFYGVRVLDDTASLLPIGTEMELKLYFEGYVPELEVGSRILVPISHNGNFWEGSVYHVFYVTESEHIISTFTEKEESGIYSGRTVRSVFREFSP